MLLKELVAVVQRPLKERYEESADFDADMDRIEKCLKDALAIARSPNFRKHAVDTDNHFNTRTAGMGNLMADAIDNALTHAKDFYSAMEDAA